MMSLQNSTIAVLALGLSLVFCGGAVTRARAQTQVQANESTSPNVDVVNPLAVNPIDRLSAIVERPLFAPNRRPPPPASITMPPSPPEPPSLTLLGVVIDAGGARAIVQAGPGNQIMRVRVGDEISGWKVTDIEPRQLVLSLDSGIATFTMFSAHSNSNSAPIIADK